MEDINTITGVTLTNTTFSPQTPTGENINEDLLYGQDYSFENQYTPESYIAGTTTNSSGKSEWYNYQINREGLQTNSTTNPTNGTTLYNLIYTGSNYWIATRGVGKISGSTVIGNSIAYADQRWFKGRIMASNV